MKGFDRINVKSAVKSVKNFDLSQTHLTTANFAQPIPLYVKRIIPRDDFTVQGGYFTRMAPLVKPTYGRFSLRTMSVFIPAFQLCDDADAFYMNQRTWKGHTTHLVYMTYLEFVSYLLSIGTDVTLASGETANSDGYIYDSGNNRVKKFDWCYVDSSGTTCYKVFVNNGGIKSRYPLTVLRALGYSIPTGVDLRTTSTWYTKFANSKINVMRILAFFKAYNDWMYQSTRYNTSPSAHYLNEIRHDVTVSGYYSSSDHCITSTLLQAFFTDLALCFESDYFTTAWAKVNAPVSIGGNSDSQSIFVAKNADSSGNDLNIFNQVDNVTVNAISLTAPILDWVESVAAYVRRNNYSGSREVEKVLSRFGIKSEDFKSNYVHLLDSDILPVNIGDVTAQAQTNDSDPAKTVDLGDYAGKGIISGQNGFNFKSKDYGYLMVIGWYTVNPMYAYGFDRDCLSLDPNDYYQPEFDGIGVDAISYGEVQTNPLALPSNSYKDDSQVFGFTERYNTDRFGRDVITGDFYDLHDDGEMNVWHLGRNVNAVRNAGSLVAQSPAFNTMKFYDESFDRVFAVTDNSVDHFYLSAQFNVKARRPMMNLNQVPRLGEGDVSVARNGNEIN